MEERILLTNKPSLKWRSDCGQYTVLISEFCLSKMVKVARAHYPNEVGTSLVGCYSDNGFEAFILDLAPLSSDSKGTRTSFYRGIAGLQKFFAKLRKICSAKWYYIGEWHSHPNAASISSGTDDRNQLMIANDSKTNCPECILVIIGGPLSNFNELGVFVYSRKRGKIILSPITNDET